MGTILYIYIYIYNEVIDTSKIRFVLWTELFRKVYNSVFRGKVITIAQYFHIKSGILLQFSRLLEHSFILNDCNHISPE